MHLFSRSLTISFILLSHLILSSQSIEEHTIEVEGITRSYVVYVPMMYDASTHSPILFNFHGYGGKARDHMEWTGMRAIADLEGFILVCPQGSRDDEGNTHWNVAGPNSKSDAQDLEFFEAMLDKLIEQYNIDTTRVYACGYSNGGFFSFDLACKLSDRVAAIGSVAGTMQLDSYNDCSPSHPTGVITIHGTEDSVVPYAGFPGWMYSMDEVNAYWAAYNQTDTNPTITLLPDLSTADNSTVEESIYANGNGCASVAHYRVIGGGHVWPLLNGNPVWENVDISASQLIWDFVSSYNTSELIECNRTAAKDYNSAGMLQVFPNPTLDILNVKSEDVNRFSYQIWSITGEKMISGILSTHDSSINISKLPQGLHILKMGAHSFKIVKE